jgi:osmoprotectant transport system permease protein
MRDYLILVGAVPAAFLALLADFVLGRVERWVTPEGIRLYQSKNQ